MNINNSTVSFSRGIKKLAVLLMLTLPLPSIANAAFIDFSGTVNSGGTGGLPVVAPFQLGDTLSGFIELNDSAVAPGASFDESDLLDFNFTVGSINFDFASSQSFGFFDGTFSADGTTLTTFDATTSFGPFPNCMSCNLTLNGGADTFVVSVFSFPFGFAEGDLNSIVRTAAVPEPSVLLLFGLGLLLVVAGQRRRS